VTADRGYLAGGHPYYQVGRGDRPLVVLPGLSDAFAPGDPSLATAVLLDRGSYRAYRETFTVYVVGRPRGLAEGTTTRDMAAAYADLLGAFDGPIPLVGVSMGGLVAQHLAADRPELVDRLVLSVSACRLGERGRRILGRWRDWAADGEWARIQRDAVAVTSGDRRRGLLAPAVGAIGRALPLDPGYPEDVVVSAQACLDHDATDRLGAIEAPTLVLGGDEDAFFPADLLERTARDVPDGRLKLFAGVGHDAVAARRREFDESVRAFLGR
jgi:pimeloyl-ACP methyl ester carboxylesterase